MLYIMTSLMWETETKTVNESQLIEIGVMIFKACVKH